MEIIKNQIFFPKMKQRFFQRKIQNSKGQNSKGVFECDPQVLELLQKRFIRIKTAKQITAISHENSKKKLKKKNKNSNNNHEKRKINWVLNLFV